MCLTYENSSLSLSLKRKLYFLCMDIIEKKIQHEVKSIEDAQDAANLETKSSAGDKYETGRAMMHIEKEKHGYQLEENQKLKRRLSQIDADHKFTQIQPGALVCTNNGNYFIGTSIGEININEFTCTTLSMGSPLGKALFHKEIGDQFEFRGKNFRVIALI